MKKIHYKTDLLSANVARAFVGRLVTDSPTTLPRLTAEVSPIFHRGHKAKGGKP